MWKSLRPWLDTHRDSRIPSVPYVKGHELRGPADPLLPATAPVTPHLRMSMVTPAQPLRESSRGPVANADPPCGASPGTPLPRCLSTKHTSKAPRGHSGGGWGPAGHGHEAALSRRPDGYTSAYWLLPPAPRASRSPRIWAAGVSAP